MALKVAISGYGRIGRLAHRLIDQDKDLELVCINTGNVAADAAAYAFKYDTAQGLYGKDVKADGENIVVGGKKIPVVQEFDAKKLPWAQYKVDVVLDCTGAYRDKEKAKAHIDAGAKKVVISAPAKGDLPTIVYNVNHNTLKNEDFVCSAASCTTNCLAPVAKVLNDKFGIVKGLMTTIHAVTNDQAIVDSYHSDWRRSRAGWQNIVPTSTGAAAAVGLVLPELKGKLDGMAMRVPTLTGSCVDLVVEFEKDTTVDEINKAVKAAANETLGYNEDQIVSNDIIGSTHGTIFDATLTSMIDQGGKKLFKIILWYDNEMSFTNQMIRTLKHISTLK